MWSAKCCVCVFWLTFSLCYGFHEFNKTLLSASVVLICFLSGFVLNHDMCFFLFRWMNYLKRNSNYFVHSAFNRTCIQFSLILVSWYKIYIYFFGFILFTNNTTSHLFHFIQTLFRCVRQSLTKITVIISHHVSILVIINANPNPQIDKYWSRELWPTKQLTKKNNTNHWPPQKNKF